MKKLFWLTTLYISVLNASAQTAYQAATIPKELLPYASAVVRKLEVVNEVRDLSNVVYRYKKVITVLNKNGDDEADLVIWYDKGRRIKYIKGVIYDEIGNFVKKITEKNFDDYAYADGFSMFNDTRLKHYQPAVVDYPYTVEFEYEVTSRQSLTFSDWNPNASTGTSVEQDSYTFTCKPDFNIRYKELNYPGHVVTGTDKTGLKSYNWEVKNLKALRTEPYSPDPEQFHTSVKIAPEKFAYEGYYGSFTNWNDLGKWTYDKLLNGRATLPAETIAQIHSLTDSITDPKKKAKALYEYMQRKNRYVSVQIGIGGFQPFTAAEVDRLSYGDCKALVNYTQALLKEVNINSYYCVVQSGDLKKSLMPDFASMAQGNHVILCLPFKNDTTWLECTNKDAPFGFLGDFTDDRWVLACTAEGGKLLHTPKYTAQQSQQIRKATVTLKEDGELAGSMVTTFEGWQYDNRPGAPGDAKEDMKDTKERYAINNFEIDKLVLTPTKSLQPVNREEINFTARDYASLSAGRYFFPANLANRNKSVPREVRNRATNVYINRGYTDVDEIIYQVPNGYKLDSNPLMVNINKPFGKFSATAIMVGNNKVVYKRKLELIDGTYDKEIYQEVVNFYQAVADADTYKVSLVKAN
jgi:hypothetical protein